MDARGKHGCEAASHGRRLERIQPREQDGGVDAIMTRRSAGGDVAKRERGTTTTSEARKKKKKKTGTVLVLMHLATDCAHAIEHDFPVGSAEVEQEWAKHAVQLACSMQQEQTQRIEVSKNRKLSQTRPQQGSQNEQSSASSNQSESNTAQRERLLASESRSLRESSAGNLSARTGFIDAQFSLGIDIVQRHQLQKVQHL